MCVQIIKLSKKRIIFHKKESRDELKNTKTFSWKHKPLFHEDIPVKSWNIYL